MKIYPKEHWNFIQFDCKEEINIFAKFFFDNDYFIRKTFHNFDRYLEYIISIKDSVFLSNEYHNNLAIELVENIQIYLPKGFDIKNVCLN